MRSLRVKYPGFLIACWLWLLPMSAWAQSTAPDLLPPEPTGPEAWLLTYGPGEHYWERFGHNAIWIRDPARGLDHAFNFGFFDFAQEGFFIRFLQGRMLYFSAARLAEKEFAEYRRTDRSIQAQKLELQPGQVEQLSRFLIREVQPENRDYLYDYYRDNCSTRVRDALDLALEGKLRRTTERVASGTSWRDHTRRLTQDNFWVYLGLETVLGAPVDRQIDRWEEMFIPQVLSDRVRDLGLVATERTLFESSQAPPPVSPEAVWLRYLLASLLLLIVLALSARLVPAVSAPGMARAWLGMSGVMGAAMCFFWLATDHDVARLNLNLLVFSPLWLVAVLWRRSWALIAGLIVGLSALACLMTVLPPGQYTLDVLAAFLPLNLAVAFLLWRNRQIPA